MSHLSSITYRVREGSCRSIVALGLMFSGVIYGQPNAPATRLAKVSIVILDESGRRRNLHLSSFSSSDRIEMTSRFLNMEATGIPYGVYRYSLAPDPNRSPSLRGRLSIDRPECFFVITLSDDQIRGRSSDMATPEEFRINGRIESMPVPPTERVWLRIQALFTSSEYTPRDVSVDAEGNFTIYQAMAGPHILTVLRGNVVLHVQLISFDAPFRSGSFVIRLPETPPPVLNVPQK
jgi:hypothetical protein